MSVEGKLCSVKRKRKSLERENSKMETIEPWWKSNATLSSTFSLLPRFSSLSSLAKVLKLLEKFFDASQMASLSTFLL